MIGYLTPGQRMADALEDYQLDCHETVLHRGAALPLVDTDMVALVKQTSHARRLRAQLDKHSDGRITAQFARAPPWCMLRARRCSAEPSSENLG